MATASHSHMPDLSASLSDSHKCAPLSDLWNLPAQSKLMAGNQTAQNNHYKQLPIHHDKLPIHHEKLPIQQQQPLPPQQQQQQQQQQPQHQGLPLQANLATSACQPPPVATPNATPNAAASSATAPSTAATPKPSEEEREQRRRASEPHKREVAFERAHASSPPLNSIISEADDEANGGHQGPFASSLWGRRVSVQPSLFTPKVAGPGGYRPRDIWGRREEYSQSAAAGYWQSPVAPFLAAPAAPQPFRKAPAPAPAAPGSAASVPLGPPANGQAPAPAAPTSAAAPVAATSPWSPVDHGNRMFIPPLSKQAPAKPLRAPGPALGPALGPPIASAASTGTTTPGTTSAASTTPSTGDPPAAASTGPGPGPGPVAATPSGSSATSASTQSLNGAAGSSPPGPSGQHLRLKKPGRPSTNTELYKTELCASYMSTGGNCPYGEKCQFAHGTQELKAVDRPPKWRSKPCQNWVKTGMCSYNERCCFRHDVPMAGQQ